MSADKGAGAGGSNPTATYATINDAAFRDFSSQTAQDISTMRAMATGYTCGASGCHSSSQFAVNKHGYGELRASDPRSSSTLDKVMTGHITNMPSGCPPCHVTADSKCAACHDMVGQATNSTAFPHANRAIIVKERSVDGTSTWDQTKAISSGNLWMYAGDATYRDGSGQPTSTATYVGSNSRRSVIEDAVGWHGGNSGNINDGTCLKCHGYQYWPVHGMQLGGTHGGRPEVNFSTR